MPMLVAALLSLLLAWARGTSPLGLAAVRLRWLALPCLAFGLQLVAFRLVGRPIAGGAGLWQLASIGLLVTFLLINLHYRTLTLVAAGAGLNLVVIMANGGYMPAAPEDLRAVGFPQVAERLEIDGHFEKTGRMDETTHLAFLGDVIRLPVPGNRPGRLISPGDGLVAAGVFLFLQEALLPGSAGTGRTGGRRRLYGWMALPRSVRHLPGSHPVQPISTSPSAAPSASTATSTPTPAKTG